MAAETTVTEPTDQEIQRAARRALERAIPVVWRSGLTRLCSATEDEHTHRDKAGQEVLCGTPGKRPLMKAFNKQALERYQDHSLGGKTGTAKAKAWGRSAAEWLARGDNVGLVPPEGVVVLDCDTLAAVEWVRDALEAGGAGHAPVQIRGEDKAHYWLRYDPQTFPLRAKRLVFQRPGDAGGSAEDEPIELDLRVGGRSQVVVAPSAHASGVDYAWVEGLGLPEAVEEVPWIPEALAAALGALLGLDPDAGEGNAQGLGIGSREPGVVRPSHESGGVGGKGASGSPVLVSGHDRLRAYVNRLCRYSPARGTDDEVRATWHSIRDRAAGLAREIYGDRDARLRAVLAEGGELDRLISSGWQRYAGLAPLVEDRTDQGYLDLARATYGDVWAWVPERKGWLRWTGECWRPCHEEEIGRAVGDLSADLLEDAARETDGDRRDRLTKMSRQLRGNAKVESILKRLRKATAVGEELLDASPWCVTFPAGLGAPAVTLDLRTDETRPCAREDWITRTLGGPLVPESSDEIDAAAGVWERFLKETLGGSDLAEYVQRAMGLSLCGRVLEPVFFFAFGRGGTGKSTLLGAVGAAFGEYAIRADFRTVVETGGGNGGSGPTSDIARLKGARLVVCSEIPERARLGARMKDLTGGDRLVARRLHASEFEFTPSHTLWVAGNTQPSADYLDSGVWRRIRQIPMDRVCERPNPFLGMELGKTPARAAILRWVVEGWRQYRAAETLGECVEVTDATQAFRTESSPIELWWNDRVQTGPGLETPTGEAYSDYCGYMDTEFGHATRSEIPRASHRGFVLALKDKGISLRKSTKGMRLLVGMGLQGGTSGALIALKQRL